MLDRITPVILTYNEAPNIGRTLQSLTWAREIVVVDSFSTDDTPDIIRQFSNARIVERAFSNHADQWNFAAFQTGIASDWILALDADYLLPPTAIDELRSLDPNGAIDGHRAAFRYCVWGEPLRSALYPPVTVLFRKAKGSFYQDGHTHRLRLDGAIAQLKEPFLHDDRKTLSHWLAAQDRYMRLEAEHIAETSWSKLNFSDRARRWPPFAPFVVFLQCYLIKGGVLDGRAGLYYALQRMLAEALLALRLIERKSSASQR